MTAPPLPGSATVIMVVNGAPITIQLDGANAPITAGNFVDLVERRVYDNTVFHRVVLTPQPFVVQGGDPQSADPNISPSLWGTGGFIDPATGQPRQIPLEIKAEGEATPRLSQTFTSPRPILPNSLGSIAMARGSALDSASSQFYFNINDNTSLNGSYAVFGNVTSGFDRVLAVRQGDRLQAARVTDGIIPSRVSSIIADANDLNGYINRLNFASLPLPYAITSDINDNILITANLQATYPAGVILLGGDDSLVGSDFDDRVYGNAGNDTVRTLGGDDLIRAGQGDDAIFGGEGNDILHGNLGNDRVEGREGNDFLRGGQGDDLLDGGDGNDYLVGDFGTDTLVGGAGTNTFILRAATDVGQRNPALVDRITDLVAVNGDRIVVVGDFAISNVGFVPSGSDTLIQLIDSGDMLGLVQDKAPSVVQGVTSVASSADLGLIVG
ncbi:MAG: peptidylprolyl isomerase [Geitlerinemataceae cyanobacterium]